MTFTSWQQARKIAADMDPAAEQRVGLVSALGSVLAQPVAAQADLPPVPSADAAGWAVSGIGPWSVVAGVDDNLLLDGCAVRVSQGAALPQGVLGVLTDKYALVEPDGSTVLIGSGGSPAPRPGMLKPGYGIAEPGSGAKVGDVLIGAGEVVNAGTIALAAAAGVDELTVIPPANVAPILLQSDLLDTGPPRRGRDRDVVAPLIPSWVMGNGGRCLPEQSVAANGSAVAATIEATGCDLTVISGAAMPGVADAAVQAVEMLGAEILIDTLDIDPGGAVLLAEMRDGRRILALPREPADAIVALALLLHPMMAATSAQPATRWPTVMLRDDIDTFGRSRAVPISIEIGELADLATAQPWGGPHGLAALAGATAVAFLDSHKGRRGDSVAMVPLPARL